MNLQQQTASYQKRKLRWLVFGFIGLLCIFGTAVFNTSLAIENELMQQSLLAVNPGGTNNIHVKSNGREITLIGSIADNSQRKTALNALNAVNGISSVTDELTLLETVVEKKVVAITPIQEAELSEAAPTLTVEEQPVAAAQLARVKENIINNPIPEETVLDDVEKPQVKSDRAIATKNDNSTIIETVTIALLDNTESKMPEPIELSLDEQKLSLRDALSSIAINEILFESSRAIITAESTPIVKQLGQALRNYPNIIVTIAGHTDSSGNKQSNQKLSRLRADAVKNYLVKNYISKSQVSAKGYGQDHPIVSNETSGGRALNRRIEIDF